MKELDSILKSFDLEDKKKMDDAIEIARSLLAQDMNPISRELCFAGILNWKFRIESDNYIELSKKLLYDAENDPSKGGAHLKNWDELEKETNDYFVNGSESGLTTGFATLDKLYTLSTNQLNIITGSPTSGKSEFMDQLVINTIQYHKWRWLIFSPENYPMKFHMDKLLSKLVGIPFRPGPIERMTQIHVDSGIKKLKQHIDFVNVSEYGTKIDSILMLAKIGKYDGLILDPWNELDSTRPSNQTETDWIGISLSKIRRWARTNNTGVWIIAHPRKMQRVEGTEEQQLPTAYDIKGSAEWYNRADNILMVNRKEFEVEIYIQKIKFKTHGDKGMVVFRYDRPTGIYSELAQKNDY